MKRDGSVAECITYTMIDPQHCCCCHNHILKKKTNQGQKTSILQRNGSVATVPWSENRHHHLTSSSWAVRERDPAGTDAGGSGPG